MRIISIIGARPQFVKAGVVTAAIGKLNIERPELNLQEIILHTGQHFDTNMSGSFLEEFKIVPQYNLGIQETLHGKMTARMIEGIESVLMDEKPDAGVVYGDTNSTLAGALAAAKLNIPIAHVEAGLRSFNMKMPEEINRILTDRISTWLFCPTQTAVENLEREGIKNGYHHVIDSGDVMLDAFRGFESVAKPGSRIKRLLNSIAGSSYYLATVHRSENTDDPERLCPILDALEKISKKKTVVMPLHPRTKNKIKEMNIRLEYIHSIDPVSYSDMIVLLKNCKGVFTDSGGLQKEAYFVNKKCVTLRDETEWVELVENGFNTLVGANTEKIMQAENEIDSVRVDWSKMLYGDGTAGEKIVKKLIEFLG